MTAQFKSLSLGLSLLFSTSLAISQDTFSIVAVDSLTREVGSAGASCLDDNIIAGGVSIIKDVLPGVGAINTQASYLVANQTEASIKMSQGWSAQDIIDWLVLNDAQNDSSRRQYGIARFDTSGTISTAAFTGSNCFDDKAHIVGPYYTIQGNILLGEYVLDSMEHRFLNASGSLANRLMAAMMGANFPGADSRCLNEGVSSQSAYLTVAGPNDPAGAAYLDLAVSSTPYGEEPIDSLLSLYGDWRLSSIPEKNQSFFEIQRRNDRIILDSRLLGSNLEIYALDGKLLRSLIIDENTALNDLWPHQVLLLRIRREDEVFLKKLAP